MFLSGKTAASLLSCSLFTGQSWPLQYAGTVDRRSKGRCGVSVCLCLVSDPSLALWATPVKSCDDASVKESMAQMITVQPNKGCRRKDCLWFQHSLLCIHTHWVKLCCSYSIKERCFRVFVNWPLPFKGVYTRLSLCQTNSLQVHTKQNKIKEFKNKQQNNCRKINCPEIEKDREATTKREVEERESFS